MSQSTLLVGLLAAAFLLFVAAKGRLGVYTGVLWGKAPSGAGSAGGDGKPAGGSGLDLSTAITVGEHLLPALVTA